MENSLELKVFRKITKNLIPFLFLLYVVAHLDRINVSFAALQMSKELKFSDAVYGLGAGIFFLGYFLFEVPSNLILERVGARIWISRIMVTWGLISSSMMFVHNPFSFYLLRFLLGVAEAGFFPGIILYLTYWFPSAQRAKSVALFMTAAPFAGVIGGPLSGLLLSLHGLAGLRGWQLLFLVEGLPAIILGLMVLLYLPNSPARARWLKPEEQTWLNQRLRLDQGVHGHKSHYTLLEIFRKGDVWLLSLIYLTLALGVNGSSLWIPQIIKSLSGVNNLQVGLLSAIPSLTAAIGMVWNGTHSDRTGERRWHIAVPIFIAAFGFVLATFKSVPVLAFLGLCVCGLGIGATYGPFWSLSTTLLGRTAAAGGIASIAAIGSLGGFLGPYLIGIVKHITHSFTGGLLLLALFLLIGGCLALLVGKRELTNEVQ